MEKKRKLNIMNFKIIIYALTIITLLSSTVTRGTYNVNVTTNADNLVDDNFPTYCCTYTLGYALVSDYADGFGTRHYYTYLNFSPPSTSHSLSSATLYVYFFLKDSDFTYANFYNVTGTWTEYDINWNNKPTDDGILAGTIVYNEPGWLSLNINNTARAWYNNELSKNGFVIKTNNTAFGKGNISTKENTSFAPYINFVFNNNISTVPQISFPSNNSRHYNNSINITWNQSSDSDSDSITYHWQMSNTSDFSNYIIQGNTSNTFSGSKTTKDGFTNYTRVRSYDGYDYSAWSTVVQFTENTKPTVPSTTQHANFHIINSTTVNWTVSTDSQSDSITYDIKVWNITGGKLIINQTGISNNFSNSFITANFTTYNYTARAYDGYEYSNWATNKSFRFTNNTPAYSNVSISPSAPSALESIVAFFNVTDADGDIITNYTLWYKDDVLQTALNNTITVIASGNTSNGEIWYFKVHGNDSYGNTTQVASSQVIIGSTNSAPSFSSITLFPDSKKYNKTININATGISDDSAQYQVQSYWYNGETKSYIGNSSWTSNTTNFINYSVTIPWQTGTTYTIYSVIYDSGNVSGLQNLTSAEKTATFTLNTTAPTLVNSSIGDDLINVGDYDTITAYFDGQGANISSAIVSVERPDATIANWTMTCNAGEIVKCTKLYTSTSDVGTYYVRFFYPLDDSGNSNAISSELSFNTQAIVSSGGGSSGGGGGGTIIIVNDTANIPSISFKNVTDFRSTEEIKQLGECLSESILLPNKCTSGKIVTAIITDVYNFWILASAFIVSFLTVLGLAVASQKPRKYVQDAILYGVLAITVILFLQLLGFNLYVFSYAFRDSSPALMSISIGAWSLIISIIGDSLSYKNRAVL